MILLPFNIRILWKQAFQVFCQIIDAFSASLIEFIMYLFVVVLHNTIY